MGARHSHSYHRYFEGFSEAVITDPVKKTESIKRVYTSDYYRADLSVQKMILLRLCYLFLYLAATVLFITASFMHVGSNSSLFGAVPEAFSVLGLAWLIAPLFNYLTISGNLMIRDYRSHHQTLCSAALYSTFCLLACFLLSVVYALLNHSDFGSQIQNAVLFLISGAATFVIWFMEHRLTYHIVKNDTEPPEGSVLIQ